jgi:hypothetical protein
MRGWAWDKLSQKKSYVTFSWLDSGQKQYYVTAQLTQCPCPLFVVSKATWNYRVKFFLSCK